MTTVVMPAATGRSRADAAARRPVVPATVPGMPGTPQPATTVFGEDFENRQSTLPVRLDDYTGASGMTYTADQAWLQNCNGWVAAFQDPGGADPSVAPQVNDCDPQGGPGTPANQAWNHVRQLAQALGVLNGTSPASANHAVSAYTNGHINNGNPGANHVEFQTDQEIPLPQNGRFLTFSVNAAETSCDVSANHARLDFSLYHGAAETPVTSQSIVPCDRGSQVSSGFWAGTFTGDAPTLFTDASVGVRMRNAQGSGSGNDHAFDDIRLMDVTPQLDKHFEIDHARVGQPVRMIFTITNTSDLLAKNGWSFTDTLPPGMRVAYPANYGTDCPSGTITANEGSNTISVTNGSLNAGQAACRVAVDVTSDFPGSFLNNADNMTELVGLNPPGDSYVHFTPAPYQSISLTKWASTDYFSAAGVPVTYYYQVTNTGDGDLFNVGVYDDLPGLGPMNCPTYVLRPGESMVCQADYFTTQQDLDRGYVRNVAYAYGMDPFDGRFYTSPQAEYVIKALINASLRIQKEANPGTFSYVGQAIDYLYRVYNTGTTTLDNVHVTDDLPGISAVDCERTTLAPGEYMQCKATYTVTQTDLDAGSLHNRAVARGTAPNIPDPVESPPADLTIPSTADPSITVDKSADPTTFSGAGETIRYTYHVVNTGNVTLDNVEINDDLPGLSQVTCDTTTLAPGQDTDCRATYTTTRDDVDNGSIHNSATASGTPPGATEPVESEPSEATVHAIPPSETGIAVRKSADPTTFSRAGEEIHYSYRVTNTGQVPLDDVGVTDRLDGLSDVNCPQRELEPGESMTCTATYTTTQDDVNRGSIRNVATAHGTPPGYDTPITSEPSESTVHSTAKQGIAIHKKVRPKTFSRVGQLLHYSYRVTNTGTVALDGVRVNDRLHGLSAIRCPKRTLAPGESMTCTATYRVRPKDLRSLVVRNRAVAQGTPPGSRVPVASRPAKAVAYGHVPVTG
ncbi:DUF7507 domain-containing protein [Actinomadura oligospora]|uniref:DUF7507 domain-containing protein n=1 Tax=Actinomadura oligospora TaxID=111804 RepID=UPI001474A452|nr:hypothetical protein [Actinomadura oligospora]